MPRDFPPLDLSDPTTRAVWLASVNAAVGDVRTLVLDATAPRGARVYLRRYLRRALKKRLDVIVTMLRALDVPAPGAP
jgi:hypothetical protein